MTGMSGMSDLRSFASRVHHIRSVWPSPLISTVDCKPLDLRSPSQLAIFIGVGGAKSGPDGSVCPLCEVTLSAGVGSMTSPSAPIRVYLNSASDDRGLFARRSKSASISADFSLCPSRAEARCNPSTALRRNGSSCSDRSYHGSACSTCPRSSRHCAV